MTATDPEESALARAKAQRVRLVKIAGVERYLARSRTVEPGSYFELSVTPWGHVLCSCPGFAYRNMCKHSAALKAQLLEAGTDAGNCDPEWREAPKDSLIRRRPTISLAAVPTNYPPSERLICIERLPEFTLRLLFL